MGLRTTMVLLAAVLALAAVLLFTNERADPSGRIQVAVLDGRSLMNAVRIRWQLGPNTTTFELQREGNGPFRLVEPIVDLASRGRLQALIAAFDSAMMAEAYPEAELDAELLSQIGLDPPRATFEATFADGSRVALEIGSEGPLGSDTYLRREGRVYRGGLALYSTLMVNLRDLREAQVFLHTNATASEVTVVQRLETGASERLRLQREGSGWRLLEPIESRADIAAVDSFLVQLLGLRIDQFPASVMRFPDREPDYAITVSGSAGQESVRIWRDDANTLIGQIETRQVDFVSTEGQYTQVFAGAAGRMRARWLIPIDDVARELVRVVVDPGAADQPRIVLSRPHAETDFRLLEPVDAQVAVTPRSELLQALNNLRVVQFVDGAPTDARFGLQGPGLTVTVLGQFQREPTVLRIGADDTRNGFEVTYVVRRDEPDRVVAVPRPAADLLRRDWSVYVSRAVLSLPVPVEMVRLVRGEAARVYRLQQGGWQPQDGAGPIGWLGDLVDELRDLRAQRVHGARLPGLGASDWNLELCRGNGDALAQLSVWDRGGSEPLLVQLPSQPGLVYELSAFLSEYMRRLWE